jgi:hypothetical protein
MRKNSTDSEVSVGYWMMALLVTCIPIVNLIVVPILAFSGGNPSKRNYYRAILVWVAMIIGLQVAVLLTGFWPQILKEVRSWW